MSKIKNPKPVSARHLTFFGGVFFCLLSVSLIINVGEINRALTIGPNFMFGVSAYVIYIFIYILGISFLFREKGFKVRFSFGLFGILIFFFGSLLLTTLIFCRKGSISISTFLDMFNHMQSSDGKSGYFSYSEFNLFSEVDYTLNGTSGQYNFGGGLAGIYLTSFVIKYLNIGWAWTFGVLLTVGGAGLFCVPFIKRAIDKRKQLALAAPKVVKAPEEQKNVASIDANKATMIRKEDYQGTTNSISLVKSAGQYDFSTEKKAPKLQSTTMRPVFGGPVVTDNSPINSNYPRDGGFVKARFVHPELADAPAPVPPVAEEKQAAETPNLAVPGEKSAHAEQLTLDFEAKPVIDAELTKVKPTFLERKVINKAEPDANLKEEVKAPTPPAKPIKWIAPSLELLDTLEITEALEVNKKVADERSVLINQVLADFNIGANVIDYTIGPAVTRFNIRYDSNVSSRSINILVDDLSRRLGGVAARFEPVVEGQIYSGLEIPNATITPVGFKEVYEDLPDVKKHPLAVAFGKNISGDVIYADFNEFPHILVAGSSGSGKSIFIHALITTLIMRNSPEQLRMAIIDPKRVEMVRYRDMPHLLCPIVSDSSQAALFLNKLVEEMNERYQLFEDAGGCTSVPEYNEYAEENHKPKIPYIVVIIDEYGDLVTTHKEASQPILLLGQKARACGIHLLISTQSPTTNIITGSIKSNLATHVALATANVTQSITILGEGGAEKLLGKGDMLVQSPLVSRVGLVRLQCCFIQRKEIMRVVGYLKEHYPTNYSERFLNLEEEAAKAGQAAVASGSVSASMDPAEEAKYQGIKEWVMGQEYMSMSRIQGECAVGFNRARRFFSRLQQEGVVSIDVEANRGCRVLMHDTTSGNGEIPTSEDYSSIG
ncbi:MAG TPA: DNA translocase FtsK [Bacilli bacterium]|mgnify:CR=1 FL=1|nr:DNA translocase FtsK [Bacilli bacterium]HPS19186.1 DNA translocase FtsK [Bacilli bacterium]